MTSVVRGVGWTLVVAGAVVLLYVVYLLWFTNLETDRAQRELAELWEAQLSEPTVVVDRDEADATDLPELPEQDADPSFPPPPGDAQMVLWFERDGQPVVIDEPLFVLGDTSLATLRSGPGAYLGSDRPGGAGNLSIAGHRTTYGAPFWGIDALRDGDTIHVLDRQGQEWVYSFREQRVVRPTDVWTVDRDPLGTGEPTITLTTCHPRFSDRERLIVWGELLGDPLPSLMGDPVAELARS